jgi:hypothetical protein
MLYGREISQCIKMLHKNEDYALFSRSWGCTKTKISEVEKALFLEAFNVVHRIMHRIMTA